MLRKEFLSQSNPYALDTCKYAQELSGPFKCNSGPGGMFSKEYCRYFFDVPVTAKMFGLLLL